jgi:hypothetical protein
LVGRGRRLRSAADQMLQSVECAGLTFDAAFDSGNASRVEQLDTDEFALWSASDCEGTTFERPWRTWFSFSVKGFQRARMVAFNIYNMNPQTKLFKQDMRPVYRVLPSKPNWTRLPFATTYTGTKEEDNFVLRFRHKCECGPDETIYFAFSFPLSYTDTIARLAWLDALFGCAPAPVTTPLAMHGQADRGAQVETSSDDARAAALALLAGVGGGAVAAPGATRRPASSVDHATPIFESVAASLKEHERRPSKPSSAPEAAASAHAAALKAAAGAPDAAASPALHELAAAAVASASAVTPARRPAGVYYHRELLTRSLEGRRIDLVTVSGTNGILAEREEALGDALMPEGGERPHLFRGKRVFLLTARVHPGEIPASHVFDGFLQFLLREDDPRAKALRERFVFKLIPLINPDGVFRGHYRADTNGLNLNRCYLSATAHEHPSVHAINAVVHQLQARGELLFYVDTHGHATKRGCFLYGNASSDPERMLNTVMYAKLVASNCRWFDFNGCVFYSERNLRNVDRHGASKEGSGRVAVYKATGTTFAYTLECNYNVGRTVNRLQPPHIPKGVDKGSVSPPPPLQRTVSPKYTPESWREVGRALAVAALDMIDANPCSRLGAPGAGGHARLRGSVNAWVRTWAKKEAKKAARRGAGDDDEEDEDDADDDGESPEDAADDGASGFSDDPLVQGVAASGGGDLRLHEHLAGAAKGMGPLDGLHSVASGLPEDGWQQLGSLGRAQPFMEDQEASSVRAASRHPHEVSGGE